MIDRADWEGRIDEILLLLGQNGMGKTLFVRMLAGLLPVDADEDGQMPELPMLRISHKLQVLSPRFQGSVIPLKDRAKKMQSFQIRYSLAG